MDDERANTHEYEEDKATEVLRSSGEAFQVGLCDRACTKIVAIVPQTSHQDFGRLEWTINHSLPVIAFYLHTLFLISSTAGFKLFDGKLQSCLLNPSSCVTIHSVSAAAILTLGNGCKSILHSLTNVSAFVAGIVANPR